MAGIEGLTHLRSLRVINSTESLYLEDLSCLANLTNLQTLRFDANGLGSLHGLENLTQLQEADFYGNEATYVDVDPLRNLTNLKILRLPLAWTISAFQY